jgi:ATP-binding cassette subfamily B protein
MAWVDPEVHLWNKSLLDNVRYGATSAPLARDALGHVMESADLKGVVDSLPNGLQTALGEGGAFLSGGQGQRVRLARGELRPGVGLVILDEALRGLDRDQRHSLLGRAREHWRDATLICITHDVAETLAFPRVVVIDQGHLVEDGDPKVLAQEPTTTFATLLATEARNRALLWERPCGDQKCFKQRNSQVTDSRACAFTYAYLVLYRRRLN